MASIVEYIDSLDNLGIFRKDGFGIVDSSGIVIGKDITLDIPKDYYIVIAAINEEHAIKVYDNLKEQGYQVTLAKHDVAVCVIPDGLLFKLNIHFIACGGCRNLIRIYGVSKEKADQYYSNTEFGLVE